MQQIENGETCHRASLTRDLLLQKHGYLVLMTTFLAVRLHQAI